MDVVVSDSKRNNFKEIGDLPKLDDFVLIKGALEGELIRLISHKHMDFIIYLRNCAIVAYPNQVGIMVCFHFKWIFNI